MNMTILPNATAVLSVGLNKPNFAKSQVRQAATMKRIISALHAAAEATTPEMTAELHKHLRANGWSEQAIKATKITYKNGEFTPEFSGKGKDAAFVHEFGDQDTPPTAAIRKFKKSTPKINDAFLSNAAKFLKGGS